MKVKPFYGMVQQVILKTQVLQMVVMKLQKKLLKKNKNSLIYSIAGGGDTIAVLNQINAIK
jgi:hypothetical protein